MIFEVKRRRSISKHLEKQFGGKWKYDQTGSWWCDDNDRHVSRVSSCGCDEPDCRHHPFYYIYGTDNKQKFRNIVGKEETIHYPEQLFL